MLLRQILAMIHRVHRTQDVQNFLVALKYDAPFCFKHLLCRFGVWKNIPLLTPCSNGCLLSFFKILVRLSTCDFSFKSLFELRQKLKKRSAGYLASRLDFQPFPKPAVLILQHREFCKVNATAAQTTTSMKNEFMFNVQISRESRFINFVSTQYFVIPRVVQCLVENARELYQELSEL